MCVSLFGAETPLVYPGPPITRASTFLFLLFLQYPCVPRLQLDGRHVWSTALAGNEHKVLLQQSEHSSAACQTAKVCIPPVTLACSSKLCAHCFTTLSDMVHWLSIHSKACGAVSAHTMDR